MRTAITGSGGLLGTALAAELPDAIALPRAGLDITSRAEVEAFDWSEVDAIVNAAAWTAVDEAESVDHLPAVWDVNATGVANLATCARQHDVLLVHISTDYVFTSGSPFIATDEKLDPRCVYGITKAAGELAARLAPRHYVVRTSWLFGDGFDFVQTMLTSSRSGRVAVVDDQVGRPTFAGDLATAVAALLCDAAPYGDYNVTGSGDVVSWAQFAAIIFELAGVDCEVDPISSDQYQELSGNSAVRPTNSALDLAGLESLGLSMPHWRDALARYLRRPADSEDHQR